MVSFNHVVFEWDDEKDALNRDKHCVSFGDAVEAFADEHHVIFVMGLWMVA